MMQTWVDRLIDEYTVGKQDLEKFKAKLDIYDKDKDDVEKRKNFTLINGMISDMDYSLDWMKKGRRPGNRRGVDRQSVYQRTALIDMDLFPSLDLTPSKRVLSDEEKKKIIDVLLEMSSRERQCYLMHMAQGMSYGQIAEELEISRRTVQQYVERAKKKVKNFVA
ncbi:sigma-70 family RNA polymerase sigma factor [Bacillus thuringiensis]|nr:sigma-70 family RNA polymerase sigma factor [Bacillus thuringiensis]